LQTPLYAIEILKNGCQAVDGMVKIAGDLDKSYGKHQIAHLDLFQTHYCCIHYKL
jgi:hypothetical protein